MPGLSDLLETECSSDQFVRQSLQQLEADFRDIALVALAEWEQTEVVAPELFQAVAALQRPSWGMWNGLIRALKDARKEALRNGSADERTRVEEAHLLRLIIEGLDEKLDAEITAELKPLADLTRTSMPKRPQLSFLLTLPINLRNRVAHDMPTEQSWWDTAAAALRPLIAYHADADPHGRFCDRSAYPAPWFLTESETRWAFNGVQRDFSIIYVSDDGQQKFSEDQSGELLAAFQRLLGKAEAQATDFRRLLSKLAPEDVKGVLMGDYLVGRPVGAGGFATVHVGRQLSTGRKVAIKILHDGMSEDIQARFQQEARFLSQLNHSEIVSVFGFGEEPWSAPRAFSLSDEEWFQKFSKSAPVKQFIAMEWIEGRTLDEVFKEQAGESVATITEWFLQAASAIAAVHSIGLIHRDIKPGNLMVNDEGAVKLMDFGIARTQHANATLMTQTGQMFGTPAYMSPEQIRSADSDTDVGPASDIYSLCATFYELYSGRRLFDHDSENAETVRTCKISGTRPARPKTVKGALPWELETIILGGLEPEVSDRYHSCDDLVRDLRHAINNEPIEYCQPSLLRRIQLGYRRNRVVTNVVATFCLLGAFNTWIYIRNVNEARLRAEIARDEAEESFQDARSMLDELFTDVSEKMLLNQPGMQRVRQELLTKTLPYYRKFIAQRGDDPSLQEEMGLAHYRVAKILEEIDSHEVALAEYANARKIQQQFVDENPDDAERLAHLGDTINAIGRAQHRLLKLEDALSEYRQARDLRERAAELKPHNGDYQRTLANSIMNIGLIEQERKHFDTARSEIARAQEIRMRSLKKFPDDVHLIRDLGKGHYNIAKLEMEQHQNRAAIENFQAAADAFRDTLTLEENDLQTRYSLAICCRLLGDLIQDQNRESAFSYYDEAQRELRQLALRNPDVPDYQSGVAGILMHLGQLKGATDGHESFLEASTVLEELVDNHPGPPEYRRDLAVCLHVLASLQYRRRELAPAVANLETAVEHLDQLVNEHPKNAAYAKQRQQSLAALTQIRAKLAQPMPQNDTTTTNGSQD